MSTSKEPKHRGTLVCVVLKAKNLPNKRSIGKQDPYCVLQMGTEQQKTKPDKRGGQHPTWDEQLHFEIFDDMEDQLQTVKQSTLSSATAKKKDKSGKALRVTCYADDNKEPEFIGEGVVDLADTLRSGEFDEWVTIKAKDRYAGEVYLELTFYSSAAPPKPKKTPKPYVGANTTYGGAGTFSEDFDESEFAPRPPAKQPGHAPIPSGFLRSTGAGNGGGGISSTTSQSHLSTPSQPTPPPQHPLRGQSSSGMSSSRSHAQFGSISGSESVPPSLRPSASLAQIDTYTPPYAPANIQRERSPAPQDGDPRRSESLSTLGPSPSSQFYGHRLPDAAPSTIVAQRMQDDLRRHSQQLSSSETYSHLPNSNSVSTIRPGDGGVDDLVGQMSSISMQQIPQAVDAGNPGQPQSYHPSSIQSAPSIQNLNQYPPYQPQSVSYGQPPGMPVSASVDQFGRPIHSLSGQEQSYGYAVAAPPIQQPYQPPTSPAPPSSAAYVTSPTYAEIPSHASISHSQSQHLIPSQISAPRPSSPAHFHAGGAVPPPPPPPRTHTPSGYHVLPTPPNGQGVDASAPYPVHQYQQVQSSSAQYPPTQQMYVTPSSNSASPPKPVGRPLPSTTPTPVPPLANTVPQASFAPQAPPSQDGYYYGAPQPQTTWNPSMPPPHPNSSPSPQPGLQHQQQPQTQPQTQPQPQQHPTPSSQPYTGLVSYPPQQSPYMPAYNGQMVPQVHAGYVQSNTAMTPSMSSSHIAHYPPPPPGPKPSEYASHPPPVNYGHPNPAQQPMVQHAYPHPQTQPMAPSHIANQQPGQQQQQHGISHAPSQQFQQQQYYYNTSSPAPTSY